MLKELDSSERQKLLDAVPPPEAIAEQLAKRVIEGRLLRSLLKLSRKIAGHKHGSANRREVANAG